MPRSVSELTSAIASGDPEAFSQFYRERFDWMMSVILQLTGRDQAFALDVLHTAMLRVIRALPALETEAQLLAWLRRTLHRCALDHVRRELRQRRRERHHASSRSKPDPMESAANHADLEWLEQAVQRLAQDQKRLLWMRYHIGMTLSQIGQALGLKAGAVDGRIARTLERLRRLATEDGYE